MLTSHTRLFSRFSVAKLALAFVLLIGVSAQAKKNPGLAKRKEIPATTTIFSPCQSSENWTIGKDLKGSLSDPDLASFESFLSGKEMSILGVSEGKRLAASANPVSQAFGRYWSARAYFSASQFVSAIEHFNTLIASPPQADTIPLQIAGMACLAEIHRRFPVRVFNKGFESVLSRYFRPNLVPSSLRGPLYEATVHSVMNGLKSGQSDSKLNQRIELLDGAGSYQDYARVAWAAHRGHLAEAVSPLKKLAKARSLPPTIKDRQNELRLLLARILYSRGKLVEATTVIDSVEKTSNVIVPALAQRPWLDIARGKYSRAVGATLALQSGNMRMTFAPESLMVAAMSLNELCLFPESLHMLGIFKRDYRSSYEWLKENAGKGAKDRKFYPESIAFLQGKKTAVPPRVATEWLRSPIFLSKQQAINQTFKQERKIKGLIKAAADYEKKKARELASLRFALAKQLAAAEVRFDRNRQNEALAELNKAKREERSKSRTLAEKEKAKADQDAQVVASAKATQKTIDAKKEKAATIVQIQADLKETIQSVGSLTDAEIQAKDKLREARIRLEPFTEEVLDTMRFAANRAAELREMNTEVAKFQEKAKRAGTKAMKGHQKEQRAKKAAELARVNLEKAKTKLTKLEAQLVEASQSAPERKAKIAEAKNEITALKERMKQAASQARESAAEARALEAQNRSTQKAWKKLADITARLKRRADLATKKRVAVERRVTTVAVGPLPPKEYETLQKKIAHVAEPERVALEALKAAQDEETPTKDKAEETRELAEKAAENAKSDATAVQEIKGSIAQKSKFILRSLDYLKNSKSAIAKAKAMLKKQEAAVETAMAAADLAQAAVVKASSASRKSADELHRAREVALVAGMRATEAAAFAKKAAKEAEAARGRAVNVEQEMKLAKKKKHAVSLSLTNAIALRDKLNGDLLASKEAVNAFEVAVEAARKNEQEQKALALEAQNELTTAKAEFDQAVLASKEAKENHHKARKQTAVSLAKRGALTKNPKVAQKVRGTPFSRDAVRPEILENSSKRLAMFVETVELKEQQQMRLHAFIPRWTKTLNQNKGKLEKIRHASLKTIEAALRRVNARMYEQLKQTLANNEFIEAEIWNGASKDIVWQNANPGYSKALASGKIKARKIASNQDVISWGTSENAFGGTQEVWEDELGGMLANLNDNCSNKEKYLSLKRGR